MVELKQAGVDVVGVSFDDKDTHKNLFSNTTWTFPAGRYQRAQLPMPTASGWVNLRKWVPRRFQ
jgi:alkyl hydroperoxide reductase subunit AhpC